MRPTETRQAAAKGASHARREECLNVVEASSGCAAARGFVKSKESLPAQAGRAGGGIVQQIRFGREAQQDRHRNAAPPRGGRRFRWGIAMRLFPALGVPIFAARIFDFVFEDQF